MRRVSACDRAMFGQSVLLVTEVAGCLCALGGVAGAQITCEDEACDTLRYTWWIIALSLVVWLTTSVLVAWKMMPQFKTPLVAAMAVAASQSMPLADSYLLQWRRCIDNVKLVCDSNQEYTLTALSAGFVTLSITHLIWIIVIGSHRDVAPSPAEQGSDSNRHTPTKPAKKRASTKARDNDNPVTHWDVPTPVSAGGGGGSRSGGSGGSDAAADAAANSMEGGVDMGALGAA